MNRILTVFILYILSFDISAQEIPINPNAYDKDNNRTGLWTILFDVDWSITTNLDSALYYRIITFDKNLPKGKVIDYYINGNKQWEGFLKTDVPEDILDGKCEWFNENGDMTERTIYFNQSIESSYFNQGELLLNLSIKNDTLIDYDLNIIDTLKFPISVLENIMLYDFENDKIALDVSLDYIKIYKTILDKEDEHYAAMLSYIASLYSNLGFYNKALSIDLKSTSIFKKLFGDNHLNYVRCLGNLSMHYDNLGDFHKSHVFAQEAHLINSKIYDLGSPEFATSLNNLAHSLQNLGDYSNAIDLFQKSLELTDSIFGNQHPEYAATLGNLSQLYFTLGNNEKNLELNIECLNIIKNFYGTKHSDYALYLNNLSLSYSAIGDHEKSLELSLESLVLSEEIYGKDHPEYVFVLSNLAAIYSDLGDYTKALELDLESLKIKEKIFGKMHPDYTLSLNNISNTYFSFGDYDKALELSLESLVLSEEIYGKEHPSYAFSLNNTGYQYYFLNRYNEAYSFLSKSQNLYFSNFKLYEKTLNKDLLSVNFNNLLSNYQTLFSISTDMDSNEKIKEQYNVFCFLKGRELSSSTSMVANVYNSQSIKLINLYEEWVDVNKTISFCYENTKNELNNLGLDISDLKDKSNALERRLVKDYSFSQPTQSLYTFDDIKSRLKYNDIYIDVVNIQSSDYSESSGNYYTYITKKDNLFPELVYLGSNSDIDSIYNYFSNYTQNRPSNKEFSYADIVYGNICYENFWGKLEPYLEGVSTVYFSPEGVYSKINPNVLYDSTASSFLIDKYDIVYVSNVEDFVHHKENTQLYERPDYINAVLIGNPTFLIGEEDVVLATNKSRSRLINQDELDSLQRGHILSQLNETQVEIDLISNNLKSKGWDVEVISGVDATETRVKAIESPKILHIATHGFFFEDQEMVQRTNMISTENKKAVANPMTRSGLIFSGAENTMNGEILANDNGWLNSYEASLLNLRGTELVVLSACETGAGDVQNGKGVYGLQRAIRVAGAESLIMSMWEVDDQATQELMTYFYDYWIDKNMSKKDAFNKAQKKIREKYKHPYYWGAFIMLGK